MESRKGWRNRDPGANEAVLALLEALRTGLGADTVGLFDDDRGDRAPANAAGGALNFWDAFDGLPCRGVDWEGWYRDLRQQGRVDTTCTCGAQHHLHGFLIHGRWALLLVAPPALPGEGVAAITSSLTALAAMLPPARTAEERAATAPYEGDAPSPGGPPPSWWARKLPQ